MLGFGTMRQFVVIFGIWYNAVVRGDMEGITIGDNSNVQDNCTLHTGNGYALTIGNGVTIGHNAIVHGCTVGDNTVIGMGSILLNGAKVGKNCIIGAGALVTGKMEIPDNSMAFGNPAKVIRNLTEAEIEDNRENAEEYVKLMMQEVKQNASNNENNLRHYMLGTLRAGYLFFNKNQKNNENGIINQRRYFIKRQFNI